MRNGTEERPAHTDVAGSEGTPEARMPPEIYLLLWQVIVKGLPSEEEQAMLGLTSEQLREIAGQYPEQFQTLRRLARITSMMDLRTLGTLLRGLLMEQLARAKSPSDIERLTKAAKQLPGWALPLGEAPTAGRTPVATGDEEFSEEALINGALAAQLERIREARGQTPLNRATRRRLASKARGK